MFDARRSRRWRKNLTLQQGNHYINLYLMGARWYDGQIGRWISPDTIVPDPANPQSLNRYSYVLGNPLKYTDSSGHIEEGEYSDATDIVNRLCQDYGVCVSVDFGYEIEPNTGLVLGFLEGLWKLDELTILEQVMQRFESEAGSAAAVKRALGGVTIRRVSEPIRAVHTSPLGLIEIGDANFSRPNAGPLEQQWGPYVAIAHELAHYWDWKTGNFWSRILGRPGAIVEGMPTAVGGEPGPTWWARQKGAVEDWAESAAMYLFPEYRSQLRAEGGSGEYYDETLPPGYTVRFGPGLRQHHYRYVSDQFRALSVSAP